jgi:uncharacterized protein
MGMEPLLLAGVAIIVFGGGVIQGAIGFAYALFVTPLLVWMGVPLPETVVIVSTCSFIQAGLGTWQLRRDLPWRTASWAIAGRLPAVGAGVLLMRKLAFFSIDEIRLFLGILIGVIIALQVACKVKPVERLHAGWGVVAFLSSGLLTGISGMGGPPLVMWVMAHNWSNQKTRAFLFAVLSSSFPLQLGLLYWAFGTQILQGFLTGLLLAPVVFLGSRVGIPLGNRMSKTLLRNLGYLALALIALSAILQPLYRMMR